MAKTDRIQHKALAVLVDGVQLHRVQRFGVSSDLSKDPTYELANSGVVEYKAGIPDVSITLETNNVGSTDNLALVVDKMVNKSLAGNAASLSGGDSNGPRAGWFRWAIKSASSNATTRTITEQDFLTCYCDFIVPVTEDNTNVSRTLWVHRAGLSGVSWSFDVNGYSSENYQFKASNKTWFLNPYKGVRLYKVHNLAAHSSSGWGTHTAQYRGLASAIPNGSSVLAYCLNENVYYNQREFTTTQGGRVNISTAGYTTGFKSGQIRVASATGTFDTANGISGNVYFLYLPKGATALGALRWDETVASRLGSSPGYLIDSTSGAFGGVARGNVKMWLYNTQGPAGYTTQIDATRGLRLQTVNIDVSLTSDQLLQLGYNDPYGISRQAPVPVNVTVSANDTDLQYFCAMAATSYTNAKKVSISDFNGSNKLMIEVYKDIAQTTKLATFTVSNMSVTSENFDEAVQGNATQEFSFTADNITIVGNGANITGY